MAGPKRREGKRRGRRVKHAWTDYEINTMLALISRGAHRDSYGSTHNVLPLATKLNEALNPAGHRGEDIDIDDVRDMLVRLQQDKKGALAFVERQPRPPGRLTRLQRLVFQKRIAHDGSLREWEVEGRRRRERQAHAESFQQWRARILQRQKLQWEKMKNAKAQGGDAEDGEVQGAGGATGYENQGQLPMTVPKKGSLARSLLRNGEAVPKPGVITKPATDDDKDMFVEQDEDTMTQSAWQMDPADAANGLVDGTSAYHTVPSQLPPLIYRASHNADRFGGQYGPAQAVGGDGRHQHLARYDRSSTGVQYHPFNASLSGGAHAERGTGGGGDWYTGTAGHRGQRELPPPFAHSPVPQRDTPFSPTATPCSPAEGYTQTERLPSINDALGGGRGAWTPTGEWNHPAQAQAGMGHGYGQMPQGATGMPRPHAATPRSTAWEGGFTHHSNEEGMRPHMGEEYGTPDASSSGTGSPHYGRGGMGQGPWSGRPAQESTRDVWANGSNTCPPAPAVAPQGNSGRPRAPDGAASKRN